MNWMLKKFKNLSIDELYKILELRSEIFVVEQECPYQDVDGKDNKSYHLFCEEGDHVIACLRILEKGVSYDEISIGRVSIKKSHRGKGLSRDMMLRAIDFVENDLNETTIKIGAQAYLSDFYSSLGFKAVSDVYLEDDIPHIDMLYKKIAK